MGFLRRMFRFNEQKEDDGVYLFFRLDGSGEIVRVRLNANADMVRDYNSNERFVRKTIIGPRTFRRAEAELTFDERMDLIEWQIEGAELVSEGEYLAQQAELKG